VRRDYWPHDRGSTTTGSASFVLEAAQPRDDNNDEAKDNDSGGGQRFIRLIILGNESK